MGNDEYLLPRRGTKGAAISDNIILQRGELYFEVPDTGIATGFGKIKMGDGSTAYSDLPYFLKQSIVDENEYFNDEMSIPFTDTSTVTNNNSELLLGVSSGNTTSNLFTNIKQLLYNFNSKIAYINTKLEALNNSKQDKLTEGNGIYISKDNVIKADNLIGTEIIVNCISSMNGRYVYCYKNGVEIGKALVSGGRATIFVDQVGTLTLKIDGIYRTVEAPYYSKYEVSFTSIGFGFRRNLNDENPATRITYLEENASFTPAHMNFTTGKFEWGSWENAWFLPRPCMVKYDGTVDYYLDPDDYTKKEDGTPSDVANVNYGGNAMMEWPKIYVWREINGSYEYVYFSNTRSTYYGKHSNMITASYFDVNNREIDHFYTGIYIPSLINNRLRSISGQVQVTSGLKMAQIAEYCANNNQGGYGTQWYSAYWADITLINDLITLMIRSTNGHNTIGQPIPYNSWINSPVTSGKLDKKGMFYGVNYRGYGVKVFGMENWYGLCNKLTNNVYVNPGYVKNYYYYKMKWNDGISSGFRSDDNIYKSTWYTKGPINYEIHGCSSRVYAVGYFGYMLRAIGNYYNEYLAECGNSDSSMNTMLTYYVGVGSHNFNSFNHIESNNLSRYGNPIRYTDTTILSLKPTKR